MSSSSKKGGRRGKKAAPPPSPPSSSDAESDGDDSERSYEAEARRWQRLGCREAELDDERAAGILETAKGMHVDDLSSDDEEAGNATGRVPLHWYEGYDHVGYDLGGGKVVAESPNDALAQALEAQGGGALTVYDKLNGRNVVVSARELEQIRRMKGGAFANRESEMYGDALDVVASATEAMPLSAAPEPKRRFLPSKWEAMRVAKLVQGLKDGTIVTRAENKAKREKARPDGDDAFLAFAESMWANDDDEEEEETRRRGPMHVPAPKLALPNHDESYRPPEEYLLEDDEREDHEGLVPKRHDTLRAVGAYEHAVKERFERCLDLYLCPRAMKRRLNIDPESLVPKLPDPKDLKPFPNALCRDFVGHDAPVVALACSPDGQWLATADGAGSLRLWEVYTGRCVFASGDLAPGPFAALAWNPRPEHGVLLLSASDGVYVVDAKTARGGDAELTAALLAGPDGDAEPREGVAAWETLAGDRPGLRVGLEKQARTVAWHAKGDYFVTVSPEALASLQCVVHRASARDSQAPLKRGDKGGAVQAAAFHPSKPFLFVATRTAVRVYHLTQQTLVKTLRCGAKWISCLRVHPSGDHVAVGSRDKRLCWFDMDLGDSAYKTLKYHDKALRAVDFHARYPLMATSADDGKVHVFHAMVYDDLMRNPLVVPVKILDAHKVSAGLGALDVAFHPTQPWLFSAGADGAVKLYHAL